MTRLVTDGAETGDLTRLSSVVSITCSNAAKRTGAYAYRSSHFSTNSAILKPFSSISEFYMRFAIYNDNTKVFSPIRWTNIGVGMGGSLRILNYGNGTSQIGMYDNTTQRATSSLFSMNINEWHVFEMRVKLAAAPNGIYTVKFDGTQVLNWSGATNGQATINGIQMHDDGSINSVTYWDDLAVNDTNGAVDNGWIGDGGVLEAQKPTGPGAYTDLTASAGSPYACIDEVPASMTDYIYSSTLNHKSTFPITAMSGLPVGASISRVTVSARALQSSAAGDKIAMLARSGSTDSQGADQPLTIAMTDYSQEYLTDPATGVAWTESGVNAAEIGVVVR